jgi:DNA-binding CsgD family transcriptional regulator
MTANPIDVVEAAYRLDLDTKAWLAELGRRLKPLIDGGRGVMAYCSDETQSPATWFANAILVDARDEDLDLARGMAAIAPEILQQVHTMQQDALASSADLVRAFPGTGPVLATYFSQQQSRGVSDNVRFGTTEPGGIGLNFVAAQPRPRRYDARTKRLWARVSAHLAAARRLRANLCSQEAVLTTNGKLEHAEGDARERPARAALREAVLRQHEARGRLRREDPARATEAWTALVAGRWSLVDRFERGGRRYLVAMRNEHALPDPRALSPRERAIAHLVVLGKSNKLIGYELGLSESTIATHVAAAMKKLGVSSRVELARLLITLGRRG